VTLTFLFKISYNLTPPPPQKKKISYEYLNLINAVRMKMERLCKKNKWYCFQEVVQSAETTPNKADVTSSNSPSPFLCGHVKKKKQMVFLFIIMQFFFFKKKNDIIAYQKKKKRPKIDIIASNIFFFFNYKS
jgi:hypothetical protein